MSELSGSASLNCKILYFKTDKLNRFKGIKTILLINSNFKVLADDNSAEDLKEMFDYFQYNAEEGLSS